MEGPEFAGHACDPRAAALLGLFHHAGVRLLATFMDDLGNLRDFTAEGAFQAGADTANKPQRIDAIADDKLPWAESLQVEAIHFVPRQSGHGGHGTDPCWSFGGEIAAQIRCKQSILLPRMQIRNNVPYRGPCAGSRQPLRTLQRPRPPSCCGGFSPPLRRAAVAHHR